MLRLGSDLDTMTLLHYAEYRLPLSNKRRVRRDHLTLGPAGAELRTVECLDDSDGIVDYPGEDYFAQIMRAYLGTGAGARCRVGDANTELIDAGHLVEFAVRWMAEHFDPTLLETAK